MMFDQYFSYIFEVSFIGWAEYLGKTTNLQEVTDKLYQIMLCTSPWAGFELTTSVVIGTDCIGCYKSNYRMIKATTAQSIYLNNVETKCPLYKQMNYYRLQVKL
jgi:hypothetical protein